MADAVLSDGSRGSVIVDETVPVSGSSSHAKGLEADYIVHFLQGVAS